MTATESVGTRDKERTRRALLDAAARAIDARGAGVSLADIAAEAGVSKGALTHHFPNRSALVRAVVEDVCERFWVVVHDLVDLAENRDGKLLRAYVRALTSRDAVVRAVFSPTSAMTVLGDAEFLRDELAADADRWRIAFAADGIPLAQSLVVRHAAEGLVTNIDSPYLNDEELDAARAHLLTLAEPA